MTTKQEPEIRSSHTLILVPPTPDVAKTNQPIAIIRAENELLAIDELMADLSQEFRV